MMLFDEIDCNFVNLLSLSSELSLTGAKFIKRSDEANNLLCKKYWLKREQFNVNNCASNHF